MSKKLPRITVSCPNCGDAFETQTARLAAGRGKYCSRACGAAANGRRHGHSAHITQSRTYHSWANMKQRCQNPKATRFPKYGAKGIRVCDKWQTFAGFLDDMGERPEGTTIDRIDANGHYEPSNCRWATPLEQSTHISRRRSVTYQGREMRLSDLARLLGIGATTLTYRIKQGWPDDHLARPSGRG